MKAHVPQQTGEAAAGAQGWGGSGAIPRRATAGTQQPGTPHGSTPGVGLPACSPGSVPHCKVFKCNFLIFLKGPQLLTCCVFFPSFFFSKAQHLISMRSSHCSPSQWDRSQANTEHSWAGGRHCAHLQPSQREQPQTPLQIRKKKGGFAL